MLLEVDDFLIGSSSPESRQWLRGVLEARFKFGKYRDLQASAVDFAGRRITVSQDRAVIDQEKYILEDVRALPMATGRLSRKDTPLEPH
eukprot:9434433-Pyramimonas_sp.AAC.1